LTRRLLTLAYAAAAAAAAGAIAITPTTFLLPALFWLLYKQPPRWGWEWSVNWALVWLTGLLGVLGAAGAVFSIIDAWKTFKFMGA
jgi:hypothetical protein